MLISAGIKSFNPAMDSSLSFLHNSSGNRSPSLSNAWSSLDFWLHFNATIALGVFNPLRKAIKV